jgi:molecular chaperone DnaK
VPTSVTELFNTSKDGQTTVKIIVLQGEADLAHQNEMLGEFTLSGLRVARRGEVEVAVTFEINSEGIVSVSARDKETGAEQSITVTASGGLTRNELFDIMDAQADYLLETRSTDELLSRREELTSLLVEVQALLPQVQQATAGQEFGADAVAKATQVLEQARAALEQGSLAQVTESIARLTRAATVFQAVLQRRA